MKTRRKAFLFVAMLLTSGMASAQVLVKGNVYGGGDLGVVTGNTEVTVNDGTIGRKLTLEQRKCDANAQITRIDFGNVYGGGNGFEILGYDQETGAPIFSETAGGVQGNTTVTIDGNAVVRHAVYGGGNIGSVGVFTPNGENGATYTAGGTARVTIQGSAIIGPTLDDLTKDDAGQALSSAAIDSAFKYLGCNEGVVYGSSRGLAGRELRHLSFADKTFVTVKGSANVVGNVLGGGENGHVQTETNVTINGSSVVGGFPLHGEDLLHDDEYTITEGIYAGSGSGTTVHLKGADAELYEDPFGVGRRVFRGNVFGGGRGTDYVSYLPGNLLGFYAGRVYGNTHVTIGGNAKIYNRVYGGGTVASVGTYEYDNPSDPGHHTISGLTNGGHAYVTINGGTIGTDGKNNGEVFGGGRGIAGSPNAQAVDEGYVGYTHVEVDGGNIKHSVYGGSANGHVLKDCEVLVKQSEGRTTVIGDTTWVRDGENYIVQVHGGWHSNVYGGGGGTTRYKKTNGQLHHSITAGRVFGDTYVTIEGGRIWHNVYGGGALASVGTYLKQEGNTIIPYVSGGYATVTITGGEIGYDGNENGMVFGSGRGEIAAPGNFLDSVTYVAYSTVNIGTGVVDPVTGTASDLSGNAKINGSVYGGGENGHVYLSSTVNVFKGTIGCSASEYASVSEENFKYRGNVYGAGCGTDMYASVSNGTPDTFNPNAGLVQGNTNVNIYGGYISRDVYGGGAMASVGMRNYKATVKHKYEDYLTQPSLSWPYDLTYVSIPTANNAGTITTGATTIDIRGGHIGTLAAPVAASGNVFGAARGEVVGPLGVYDTVALVRKTEININFTPPTGTIGNETENCILGSVYGSGENGETYEDTKITLTNGRIVGSVFGGGKGTDTYSVQLKDPNDPTGQTYLSPSPQRSITAGKVYGNTEVNINGGIVEHNVFGGGNLASVGKGNYIGYGEITTQASGGPDYDEDTYGGLCKVTINGGTIGTDGLPDYSGNVNGFVFGSSKGITFVNVSNTPRYEYSRDFFLGYANKTEVTIGDATVATTPTVKGSVFGGGEDGHVRWHTEVTVNKGTIGEEFVASNPETDSINKWVYRGNVYGAGRGIDYIDPSAASPEFCSSAGSVTLNTTVTVKGGTIHRNVYGGGSNASAGPPSIPGATYSPGTSLCKVNIEGGTIGQKDTDGLLVYGGHVFGAGRGHRDLLNTNNIGRFATSNETQVNIETGADVYGNVYGGGEIGQVKKDALVNMKNGIVEGSVYGGGKGEEIDEKAALVLGNTTVDMKNGTVERSIYGGGQLGSVGTYTEYTPVTYPSTHPHNPLGVVNVPKTCNPATGLTTVKVSGGSVGHYGSLMPWVDHNPNDDDRGWIFCGGQGLADSINYYKAIALGVARSTYLEISNTSDDVRPLITASVYGGAENGLVLGNTHVKIAGGQIGSGLVSKTTTNPIVGTFDPIYDEAKWTAAIDAINDGTIATALASGGSLNGYFHECDAWTFASPYNVYDINADDYTSNGGALTGSDGHSFFGNVFGGGSGYYPIAPGVWRRTAGRVCGNTHVEITGGHILTSVYGGNETTDVMGKCTVTMSGGTLGVPRDSTSIAHHPTTCYLFGAGMGDARTAFNTWSNVNEVEVNVTGGTIFGSVFGGGEDGHVLGDAVVNIGCEEGKSPLIGTLGYSYVDGNVFGGGRGFQAFALTAGVVRGNIEVNIMGGTMLGSIYGGGRLASVGTYLVADNNTNYGKMMVDNGTNDTHGHIKINIGYAPNTGGTPMTQKSDITIGNDHESRDHYKAHNYGGNVYGGGMGRLEMLDGTTNPNWHQMGRVKNTVVNINQGDGKTTIIKGAVYGGGEMGTVGGEAANTTDWHGTKVNISGGTLWFDVFGGGHGSDNLTKLAVLDNTTTPSITVTPAQMAGRVFGNTNVNVSGGWIKKCIYGGGELASVGRITDSIKHTSTTGYEESWPYQFNYVANTGIDSISVTGGRIGITGKDYFGPWAKDTDDEWKPIYYSGTPPEAHFYDFTISTDKENFKKACKDNGDIYGGSMGKVGSKYASAHWGNVSATTIEIEYLNNNTTPSNYNPSTTDMSGIKYMTGYYPSWSDWQTWVNSHGGLGTNGCIAGAVYGGAEDGHVNGDTKITLNRGLVGHAVYGGGKGKDKYQGNYVPTAGKVYGDTYININGGYVVRNVFGGGNLASVGKGNYIDYGETAGTLGMTHANTSGRTYVNIYGGQLGTLNPSKPSDAFKDNIPYGSVFGGCRGLADGAVALNEHRFGFTNNTFVTIGETATAVTPGSTIYPRIYGSVYGGAQDGHVRRNTKVTVNDGEIGVAYGATPEVAHNTMGVPAWPLSQANLLAGNIGLDDPNWTDRGNVFGSGSGLGVLDENATNPNASTNYALRAGSVFETTEVEIKGGLVHRGVYGGGNLASVLGLGTGTGHDKVKVTVSDYAKVGLQTDIAGEYYVSHDNTKDTVYFSYGGNVFGAGKGFASDDFTNFCNVINTDVIVNNGFVYGDVYGGGENGHVTDSTNVKITGNASVGILLPDEDGGTGTWGGTTTYDGNVFGGGMGSGAIVDVDPGEAVVNEFRIHKHCGRVGGNTHVKMDGGTIQGTIFGGGRLALVGVDENGEITAFANETTHVYDSVSATTGKHGLATIEVSGTASIGNPDGYKLLNESDESVGDIFGSGKGDVKNYQDIMAGRVANSKIRISDSPRIYGSVFGGGEMGGIGYYYEGSSTYEGTSIHKQVFYDKTGTSDIAISGNPEIGTDTEFTSAYAATHPDWTVYDTDGSLIHTCTGNVFGGAQGDVNINKPHWVSMAKSKQSKVVINGGTIKSRVFGGAEQGFVTGNTRVEINGGTIGTLVTPTSGTLSPYYYGGVLGGGYGSHREDYNVLTHQNDSTAALGGTLWRPDYLAGRVYGNARVDVLGGTIKGNVFGGAAYAYLGGYGSNPKGDVLVNIGKEDVEGQPIVGSATFYGSVFGANNRGGTPYGNVNVNVYHTAHRTWTEGTVSYTDFAPTLPTGLEWTPDLLFENINGTGHFDKKQRYAIKQVFGGGNRADFTPNSANRTVVPRSTTVHVYYCENTIEDLYGGGNAADIGIEGTNGSANSNVVVDGGRFYRVFGGGNGSEEPANIYGTASTEINAGVIQEVYGGGNSNGFIDNINLEITNANADVCNAFIYDVFGGNNEAEIIGDIVSVINCGDGYQHEFYGANNNATIYGNVTTNVFGGTTDFLFGGSKGSSQEAHIRQFPSYDEITADQALPANQRKYSQSLLEYMNYDPTNSNIFKTELVHTKGNVTLNIFGGAITQAAFGGSDVNGTIDGKITVNVFDAETTCALDLNNLYGAGRNTDYDPIYDLPTGTTERISPEINVIHGTVKGSVYGGGQGSNADVTANPVVNIGYYPDLGEYDPEGNHEGDVMDALYDTIIKHTPGWTGTTWGIPHYAASVNLEVYGGGELAAVSGNTRVNMFRGTVGTDGIGSAVNGTKGYNGNIYGGGKGSYSSLTSLTDGHVEGNTVVEMQGGTVKGNIYGGGRLALTGIDEDGVMQEGIDHGHTKVMIKGGTVGNAAVIETFTEFSMGNIYGGGKGYLDTDHPSSNNAEKSLLLGLTKNTEVEISQPTSTATHVYGIVLGGGEIASVGKYTLTKDGSGNITNIAVTEGLAKVKISGGTIGDDYSQMRADTYETGSPWLYYNDDLGYVYGGGEGWSDKPSLYPTVQESATSPMSLLDLVATVQSTDVEISGTAWVKASVFGGSESGHVRGDTKVTIKGGQIGAGNNSGSSEDVWYTDAHFADPTSTTWYPTAHWDYASPYTPFDPELLSHGTVPKDGRSWFGNVFGGGSGWFPYVVNEGTEENPIWKSYWNENSGKVWGNTEVIIEGGHILNNVYGANESTDVGDFGIADATYTGEHPLVHVGDLYCKQGGKATVKISGGTIGIPLTESQIQARPLFGNVFGGGAGDPRRIFNVHTNVDTTDIQITGGHIYGSVFGGAEQGHVVRGTSVSISEAEGKTITIGTTGFSGYDGHVFGGGKGDETDYDPYMDNTTTPPTMVNPNFDCGRVGGTTKVAMSSGTVLGNLYGGGMIALTGVGRKGLENYTDNGFWSFINDDPQGNKVYDSIHHGFARVELSGGTIGNPADNDGLTLLLKAQESGNVYGGGRGNDKEYEEDDFGRAAKASVTISGCPRIYGSVFAGGQRANVGHWNSYDTWYTTGTGKTEVTVNGTPTIGTEKEFTYAYATGTGASAPVNTVYETVNNAKMLSHTRTGNVFGGGEGLLGLKSNKYAVGLEQGHCRTTRVNIGTAEGSNPTIMSCVFGGSEEGAVWGDTKVTIARGTIGQTGLTSQILPSGTGTYSFGSVFGGSYGADSYLRFPGNTTITELARDSINRLGGRVYGNTEVAITGGIVRGNVFGGGDMASVGEWTNVLADPTNQNSAVIDFAPALNKWGNITGHAKVNVSGTAIIGPMDGTGLNAYVYGGGKGIGNDPTNLRNKYCNINSTEVTVNLTYSSMNPEAADPEALWDEDTDGRIYGSIYGGGSDCHVLGDTKVVLNGGLIGTYVPGTGTDPGTITDYGGNIFGGGRNFLRKNYAAGRVAGNPEIEMNNGVVYGAIFGGGRNAVTGTGLDGMTMRDDVDDDQTTDEDETEIHGHTTVKVKGGTVGYKPLVTSYLDRPIGEVFGGGKGNFEGIALSGHPAASPLLIALVKNTVVEISQADDNVPTYVLNSVYGGGEVGNLGHFTWKWTQSGDDIYDIDLMDDTGTTNVTIKGGRIGVERMVMSYELVGGTGPDKFNPKTNPVGNVFGGCKGISIAPTTYANNIRTARFGNKYLVDLMATCGTTNVTITNETIGEEPNQTVRKPWVKGSVYGGSACGHVVGDTEVTIAGGQIGASDDGSTDHAQYNDGDFVNAFDVDLDDPDNSEHLMNPTYHWEYDPNTLRPFDVVAIYNGQTSGASVDTYKPTDGKTWYGNVFGGGSGFLPYVTGSGTNVDPYVSHWNRESGKVYGNSTVTITGGHILSCVYGGCEVSDVGMYEYNTTIHGDVHNTNSSLGTLADNGTATVDMQGGTVGVPRTTDQVRNHPIPGYVYGSGKGDPRIYFNTWTNVNETSVTMSGGKIFGCLFGGGEDGHVMGDVTMSVSETDGNTNPTVIGCTGLSGAEGNVFGGGRGTTNEALTAGTVGGNVDLTVSGGKVLSSVFGGGNRGSVGTYLVDKEYNNGSGMVTNPYYGKMREDGGGKTYGYTTVTVSGSTIVGNSKVTPTHTDPITTGGNVFGGGRGIYKAYSGSGDMPIWPSQARVKQTEVTVKGTATVKNSVYGGGKVGTVRDDATVYVKENCIIGGNYGTNQYCGHVFGGGQGYESLDDQNDSTEFVGHSMPAIYLAGRVYGNTNVYIQGGHVYENVFGGGHVSSVGWVKDGTLVDGVATVKMTGGIIGELDYSAVNAYIFGGPKGGSNTAMKAYCNVNSTDVEVDYTTSSTNRLWGSIFGGGSDGHVLGDAKVTLKSGTVGTDGITGYDGNIFGGGRNYHESGLTAGRVGGNIEVSMTGGTLQGNIYGGGRQGLTGVDENGVAYTTNTADHGNITVNVSSGTVGTGDASETSGHVYGGGKGQANSSQTGYNPNRLGEVRSTDVTIQGNATVNGSVFGGSENGWVLENSSATIAGTATIGHDANNYQGNVFGGGRGVKKTPSTTYDPEAGRVMGIARANVSGGTIKRHVFGGGNSGIVEDARIVNIDEADPTKPTTINGSVFGGSNEIPDEDGTTTPPTLYSGHGNLKTVNVRGGTIEGNVFGCSYGSNEGTGATNWTSFVNITGGTIGTNGINNGNVYGAGYAGLVNGSVCINVGTNTIAYKDDHNEWQPRNASNTFYDDAGGGTPVTPSASDLLIKGSAFGGSNYVDVGGQQEDRWNTFDITGYSRMYIDGEGYHTDNNTTPYMDINGGLYGCGTHCESGAMGRQVTLRKYGHRNADATTGEMTGATRTLKTAQRIGTFVLDDSNVVFSGYEDISGKSDTLFAVVKINEDFRVANASSMILGTVDGLSVTPAYIDSIRNIHSSYLTSGDLYQDADLSALPWGWIGINPEAPASPTIDNIKMYHINGTTLQTPALTAAQENVILFNGNSRLWVRYNEKKLGDAQVKQYYGELDGFFRMRADYYQPYGNESFAEARPKLTQGNSGIGSGGTAVNPADGGFLSYDHTRNFYDLDGGNTYTNTLQHPYTNVMELSGKGDMEEYRKWCIPVILGKPWYVDGRTEGEGGIGVNNMDLDRGLYPNKPKKTISSKDGNSGIYAGATAMVEGIQDHVEFKQDIDAIYVVGPVSSAEELAANILSGLNKYDDKPLRLFRYPGGHTLTANDPQLATDPGPNYGAMVDVQDQNLTLNNVVVDGLFGYEGYDGYGHTIPNSFNPKGATEPLVLTHSGAVLNLNGGTTLKNGYNNHDAANTWFTDPDYVSTTVHDGGALYVDPEATVNMSGLVTIQGNKQCRMKGGLDHAVESNVYLPTFEKYFNITGQLDVETGIGVTNPKRNTNSDFNRNTLSPVALAGDENWAEKAWSNNNIIDDQQWFFGNGNNSTYYNQGNAKADNFLYFGWTWANVVRSKPDTDSYEEILSGELQTLTGINVKDGNGLAWLISKSYGMNEESATRFTNIDVQLKGDCNMSQYVWVPLGSKEDYSFRGIYDGQGHIISGLNIDYIGPGDTRYNSNYYGMFGKVVNGEVKRTFVVDSYIHSSKSVTASSAVIGGLVGYLEGSTAEVSSSEAAVTISMPNLTNDHDMIAGGLVGHVESGEVHSSMAMPIFDIGKNSKGPVGGLVGTANNGSVKNSFTNAEFDIHKDNKGAEMGGLLGYNGQKEVSAGAEMGNCYMMMHDSPNLTTDNFGTIAAFDETFEQTVYNINSCYVMSETGFKLVMGGNDSEYGTCHPYTPVIGADILGYMYADNKVVGISSTTDTTLFQLLNKWVAENDAKYARWARPALQEINGDYPVLLLSDEHHQGEFSSVGTYAGGRVLQYGGTVRDGNQLSSALKRDNVSSTDPDYLFVYGDITEHNEAVTAASIKQAKVSVYEHASLIDNSTLANCENTYVGITFDNSCRHAIASSGINVGLYGSEITQLPRDWHMFSSPLRNAPLGFDYQGDNVPGSPHINSPWVDQTLEFSWLNNDQPNGNKRYWMKGWTNSQGPTNVANFTQANWVDGYFPSDIPDRTKFGVTCIPGTDEEHCFPYGMDFYTWNEPRYHWINFKRNGPNHWHSDIPHAHLDYVPVAGATANKNEDNLIVGRGYMASIATQTYMQSHGTLTSSNASIMLTHEGPNLTGWNLVGNPYHGYLDFKELAKGDNLELLDEFINENGDNEGAFYVVYNADAYDIGGDATTAFKYYPVNCSQNGDYAERYLHPHQGFYVMAKKAGSLAFNESMLASREDVEHYTNGNGSHFRDEQPAYPLVNLYLSSDKGCADVTVIEFERPMWGGATKLKELRVGNGLFYAHHDNIFYAALFAPAGIERVPLWFEAKEDDIFTMKWNTANGDFHSMYLIDNITGVQYDMLRNDTYVFEGHKDDYKSRFYIVFDVTDVEEHEDDFFVIFHGSECVVTGEGDLEFIDVLGHVLMHTHVDGGQTRVSLPKVAPSVYFMRLTNGKSTKVQKIVIDENK